MPSGRTSASFGGAFTSGLTSLGLDYQVVHTPYRPTQPFVQTIALNVRIPLGNYRISAASFVTADGRVNYTGRQARSSMPVTFMTGGNSARRNQVRAIHRRREPSSTNPASRSTVRRSTSVDRRCSPIRAAASSFEFRAVARRAFACWSMSSSQRADSRWCRPRRRRRRRSNVRACRSRSSFGEFRRIVFRPISRRRQRIALREPNE